MKPDPESGKIIVFPTQPVKRRRVVYAIKLLLPMLVCLALFFALLLWAHAGPPPCEPYMNC